MQALWELQCVSLRGTDRPRLDRVSCTIQPGITAILGESGAGKSSLLNLLAGMEVPDTGRIQRFSRGKDCLPVYWAPQGGGLWPHLSAWQHLADICEDSNRADEILSEFDLTSRRNAYPDELSQGEKARLSVARAIAAAPDVLLFDEPLVHVDGPGKESGWQAVRRFVQESGASVVLTTHEPDVVLREAKSVICLDSGRIVYDGDVTQLYSDPPDENCGRFLGPFNWMIGDEQRSWLPPSDCRETPRCLRPEQLLLEPAELTNSRFEVVSSVFMGTHAETCVKDLRTGATRVVIHRPAAAMTSGQRVDLSIVIQKATQAGRNGDCP